MQKMHLGQDARQMNRAVRGAPPLVLINDSKSEAECISKKWHVVRCCAEALHISRRLAAQIRKFKNRLLKRVLCSHLRWRPRPHA